MNTAIQQIVEGWQREGGGDITALVRQLTEREVELADRLRLTAASNGLAIPFVSLVLAEAGLGDTPSEEELHLLRTQMQQLEQESRATHERRQTLLNQFLHEFFGVSG